MASSSIRLLLRLASCLAFAAVSCNRSAPEPAAPVQPVAPRAEPAPASPPPAEPLKEGATAASPTPDAPASAADAPNEPAKPPIGEAQPNPKTAGKKQTPRTREIQPQPGNATCIEMYGTCTPPPDRLCTSSALSVECGQRAQVPSSGEWVHCNCDGR